MQKLSAYFFSGTGNTRYVTEELCKRLSTKYETAIFDVARTETLDLNSDVVLLAFPIYGSAPPVPMRRFVYNNAAAIRGREIIVAATQFLFSGDGAASLGRTVEKMGGKVRFAEHFNMPSNIADFPFPKIRNGAEIAGKLRKTQQRLDAFACNILSDTNFRRGFDIFSHAVGYLGQRKWWRKGENAKKTALTIDASRCVGCGVCAKNCPVGNIALDKGRALPRGNCVFCYRCVNACPKQAIVLFGKKPPEVQYKGPRV